MIYFLDTSVLVKRYFEEPGSGAVRALFKRNEKIALSRITEAEASAVIARALHHGEISGQACARALELLDADLAEARIVEIRRTLMKTVRALTLRWPLRGYDAVQLACALRLRSQAGAVDFWCADDELLAAARGEGLRVTRG